MHDLVQLDVSDGCATITLDRPEARNALSLELIESLGEAVAAVEREVEAGRARVLTLAGAGPAFCAGMDLKAVMSDPGAMRRMLGGFARALRRLHELPVPAIAVVRGAAIGGGCGLMVATDFAVTHPEAKIGYPEVSLGLCPAVVAPWLMRRVGPGRARSLLLLGRTMSGREGFELGLATHLAEAARLDDEAAALARELAQGSPTALATTKRWLNELEGALSDELVDKGAALSADVLAGPDAQARLRARFGGD